MALADQECIPCRGGVPPLTREAVARLVPELDGWAVVNNHHLSKNVTFPDFKSALAYVDRVGALAEAEGHHPDVHLAWGRVRLEVWTHKIGGLTEADFVLAAKIDRLPR